MIYLRKLLRIPTNVCVHLHRKKATNAPEVVAQLHRIVLLNVEGLVRVRRKVLEALVLSAIVFAVRHYKVLEGVQYPEAEVGRYLAIVAGVDRRP